jgi:hypothetical protein
MARIVACTPEITVLFHGPFLYPIHARCLFGDACTNPCNRTQRPRVIEAGRPAKPRLSEMPVAGEGPLGYSRLSALGLSGAGVFGTLSGGMNMEWTTPQHEVVDLNCEVSSYANAEL